MLKHIGTEVKSAPTIRPEPSAARPRTVSTRCRPPIYLDDIRRRAYDKWQTAGKPDGDCARFWLEAEQDLLRQAAGE